MDSDMQQGPSTTPATAATAPQIRSRITVVCAECKRLKLKCDRMNPCGSCQKRDTVARCIYSPAAAEKVDLHSLNNRLIQVEATLAQLTSGHFVPSYPFSNPSSSNGPPPPLLSSNVTLNPPTIQHSSLAIPLEEIGGTWLNEIDLGFNLPARFVASSKDGTCANVKVEPHSIDIPDSLSGELDDFDMTDRSSTSSSSSSSANRAPTTTIPSPNLATLSISSPNGHILLPPTSAYHLSPPPFSSRSSKPQLTPALISLLPSLNTYTSSRQLSQQPTLLSYLNLAEESTAYTYPFLNWKTLRERALELIVNARPNASSPAANVRDKEMAWEKEKERERDKKDREASQARQLFMGSATSRTRPVFGTGATGVGDITMKDLSSQSSRSPYRPEISEDSSERPSASLRRDESIPFFAVLCIAVALGTYEVEKRSAKIARDDSSRRAGRLNGKSNSTQDSTYWYSLSVQAIGIWEASVAVKAVPNETPSTPVEHRDSSEIRQTKEDQQFEMDYISACLLQLTFLSKEGLNTTLTDKTSDNHKYSPRKRSPGLSKDLSKVQSAKGVAAVMFPLVGKVVNYARQMSLNKDPEDMGLSTYRMQESESEFSTPSGTAASSDSNNACGIPSGAKKARSNNKLSDPSILANLSSSRAARESRFTLYDAEIRRRVWWTIMYYDLFISDVMNQPPLIADNSFNTKRPVANVDEKTFGPTAIRIPPPMDGGDDGTGYSKDGMRYFEIRSRLTMLVRNIKRRMNTPEFGHAQQVRTSYYGSSPTSCCYSIDQAASMEAEVRAWLNELPSYYQVDGDNVQDHVPEPMLIAQRCEVAMTAHRLVLRVYLPFLKKHAAGVPHQASLGSINAAHGIMKAAKALSELWKLQGPLIPSSLSPALFDFYPFSRCVFDAAVVCAHAVIKQPSTVWAAAAMEDVDVALEIMKGISPSKFSSAVGATYVVDSSDCIRIIEALKLNAEGGEGLGRGKSPNVPSKRKHHEVDESRTSSPPPVPAYVYPTVPTIISSPAQEFTPTSVVSHSAQPVPPKRQLPFPVVMGGDKARNESNTITSLRGNDKDKKAKKAYPVVGVRKRPPKDSSPFAQSPVLQSPTTISNVPTSAPGSRRQSVSTPVIEKPSSASARTMYQNSHQQSTATSQPPPFQSPNIPQLQAAAAQEQFAYRSRSSSLSQDPRLHVQRPRRDSTLSTTSDYPMGTRHEDQHADLSASSAPPQNAIIPETHLGPSMSSRQHTLQQPYVESPTSYEAPLEQTPHFEFPFNHQPAAADGFNATRNNSFDPRTDTFSPSSSSPYGPASSSNGTMSTSDSPYAITNNTPTFNSQPSPPSFSPKHSIHIPAQSQEYYGTAGMFEGYTNTTSAAQPGIMHGDVVQSVISGALDETMMFDPVSYDIKPSMEELNEQHRQQHTYQTYNSDPRSQSQLHNAVPSSQMWAALPQQGHVSDAAPSYWGDPDIPPDNRAFYQT